MAGGLFGGSKTTGSIPEWLEEPTKRMLARSEAIGQGGYMPWYGPDVAALDKAQVAAMRNTHDAANAFGMNADLPSIPGATDYGGGTWGYSSAPIFEAAQQALATNRPGQAEFYNSFFIDPITGQPGSNTYNPITGQPLTAGPDPYAGNDNSDNSGLPANMQPQDMHLPPMQGPPVAGGLFDTTGYDSAWDKFNGGGPGQSLFGGWF